MSKSSSKQTHSVENNVSGDNIEIAHKNARKTYAQAVTNTEPRQPQNEKSKQTDEQANEKNWALQLILFV